MVRLNWGMIGALALCLIVWAVPALAYLLS